MALWAGKMIKGILGVTGVARAPNRNPMETSIRRLPFLPTADIGAPTLPRQSLFHYLFPESRVRSDRAKSAIPPDSIALIDGISGRRVSREAFRLRCQAVAGALRARGLKRGDVVGVMGLNSIEWLVAFHASHCAGLRVSPINWAYTPSEQLHQLSHSGVSLIFTSATLLPNLYKAFELAKSQNKNFSIPKKDIILLETKAARYSDLKDYSCIDDLDAKPMEPETFENGQEHETAIMCYSSGTTGLGKGVETTHFNMTSQLQAINTVYEPNDIKKDVHLTFLPFSHMYALTLDVVHCLTTGTTMVILPRFEEKSVLEAIQKYKVTWSLVVPPILIILRESKLLDKYDLTTLKGMMSAAAPLGDDLAKSVEKRLPNCRIVQAYGLTETTPLITLMTTRDGDGRHGSIGKLLPTFEARLVDTETGKDIRDAGKAGELWVRGPSVMKGYYKNPEATEGTFAPDPTGRWFKTGDSATRDEGGFYRIADRLKELIKYKGFQVAPAELESVLLTHPEVGDTAVIGIYREELATELPRAYVVPKGGLDSLTKREGKAGMARFAQEVEAWMVEQVANHKRLRGGVILIDAIPKSPTGKILRKNLRKLVEEEDKRSKGKL